MYEIKIAKSKFTTICIFLILSWMRRKKKRCNSLLNTLRKCFIWNNLFLLTHITHTTVLKPVGHFVHPFTLLYAFSTCIFRNGLQQSQALREFNKVKWKWGQKWQLLHWSSVVNIQTFVIISTLSRDTMFRCNCTAKEQRKGTIF